MEPSWASTGYGSGEGGIRTLGTLWVHTLSRRAPSAARAPLRRANRRKCRREVQAVAAGHPVRTAAQNVVARRAGWTAHRPRHGRRGALDAGGGGAGGGGPPPPPPPRA